MPFGETVARLRFSLSSGGVLAILGLSRPTVTDYLIAAAAVPANLIHRAAGRLRGSPDTPRPPIRDPEQTLAEIRRQAGVLLPGAVIRRHLYWRYSLIYRRP